MLIIIVTDGSYSKRVSLHRDCIACGQSHPLGLRLLFTVLEPGRVECRTTCDKRWNGYAAFVHGGIAATLADAAMTHALFSLGITAVTASLHIRYRHVLVNESALKVEARRIQVRRHVQYMRASIYQDNRLCVSAEAQFIETEIDPLSPLF